MNKVKNLMAKMSDEIKELGKKFPLTMLLIFFVTILYTIWVDQDFSKSTEEMLEKICLFCIIWGVGTIFTAIWFAKKTNKIASYGLTGIVSLIFTAILTSNMAENAVQADRVLRFLATYVSILILLSIYKSIQNANLKLEEYLLKVFRDLFNLTATYIILNIGVVILTAIFVQLILDGHYGSIMERLFVLLFGLFYVPSMVYTFSGISKKEVGSFIKGLVLYVLLPLTTIAIAIIYLYLAKIILLQDMPQNMIYRILAGIFIAYFPVWNMASNYAEDKRIIGKIAKTLPYAYTPFILLEIYSIGVRINEFGITPMRYISCMFIVFQVISLVLTFYKKNEKISNICLYAIILVVIVFISPWNYENVSNWSQKRIIEKKLPENTSFEELSEEDKTRVNSAYEYLKYDSINGEKMIPSYLTDEEKQQIEQYTNLERNNCDYPKYVSLDCKLELNIEEYSKITYVSGENEDKKSAIIKLDEIGRTIDLNDKISEIISKDKTENADLEEDFEENHIIKISDTEDFYIARISLSYYKTSQSFNFLDIEGYILER